MATSQSTMTVDQTTFQGPVPDCTDFLNSLKTYTIADIQRLEQVALEQEQKGVTGGGRLTIALAGLCFAVVEAVGLLQKNDLSSPGSYDHALSNGNYRQRASVL
jgi:hypothetical protein